MHHFKNLLSAPAATFFAVTPVHAADESRLNDLRSVISSVRNELDLHKLKVCIPAGTKIPIILKDYIDSDLSHDGDDFTAQTIEDLNIDGHVVLPSSTKIIGRVAFLEPTGPTQGAKTFDSAMLSGNFVRIPAKLVARGSMVHAKRGLKDISLFSKPISGHVSGLVNSASSGAQIKPEPEIAFPFDDANLPVGAVILLAKRALKVHLEPLDELKIEIYEDLNLECPDTKQ
jgi:hypothetical protein